MLTYAEATYAENCSLNADTCPHAAGTHIYIIYICMCVRVCVCVCVSVCTCGSQLELGAHLHLKTLRSPSAVSCRPPSFDLLLSSFRRQSSRHPSWPLSKEPEPNSEIRADDSSCWQLLRLRRCLATSPQPTHFAASFTTGFSWLYYYHWIYAASSLVLPAEVLGLHNIPRTHMCSLCRSHCSSCNPCTPDWPRV